MTAPQIPERPACDGETCSCGRPATIVYQLGEKFGDVPFCGVESGGAPQTPPPCPVHDWCARRHDPDEPAQADDHVSANRAAPDAFLALYHPYREDRLCLLFGTGGSETATIRLVRSAEARMLATVTIEPVAKALRGAADELDRINGGGS